MQSLFWGVIGHRTRLDRYEALKTLREEFDRDESAFELEFENFGCCTDEDARTIFLLRSFGFPLRHWMTPSCGSTEAVSLYNAYEAILLTLLRRRIGHALDLARLVAAYHLVDSITINPLCWDSPSTCSTDPKPCHK